MGKANVMDRTEFETEAHRDGYLLRECEIKPDDPLRTPHTHDFDARLFVLSGSVTIVRSEDSQTYIEGESCIVRAGTLHVEESGDDGARYLAALRLPSKVAAAA
jgi:mannose-6-phosphate isomerase-like protein (cupin superfamily)